MTHLPLSSSSLASAAHEEDVLEIRFQNGRLYRATGVPADELEKLLTAESAGKHFNAHLRNTYTFTRVDEDDNGPREG